MEDKRKDYKNMIHDGQYFQPLAFEADGFKCKEATELLRAWSKLWAEQRDGSPDAAARMLFAWTAELDFIRAKFLAKCIEERGRLSSEVQDNEDKIGADVRPPRSSYPEMFNAR
jgi:hypothetical protein